MSKTAQKIAEEKLVAVIRSDSPENALKICGKCIDEGIRLIEVTFTVPNADLIITELKKRYANMGVVIGAGTVLDTETARCAMLAGADFIVSPIVNEAVIKMCHRYGIVSVPGAFTPNEVYNALELGADMVKIFPGSNCTPSYLKDLHGPFPNALFMVTGNVTIENASEWIRCGASAVGVGGLLTNSALKDAPEVFSQKVKALLAAVNDI